MPTEPKLGSFEPPADLEFGPIPGPICQSCAMPLLSPADFGTTAAGTRQNDYCHFCFANGSFADPDVTYDQMLEKTIVLGAAATGQTVAAMRAAVTPLFPTLKRWRLSSV